MTYNNPDALRELLQRPRQEIIPMRGIRDKARALPYGSTVTVTCSPTRGVEATVKLAAQLAELGYNAVPHLAARRFSSRAHVEESSDTLIAAGVRDVFVVGGDGTNQAGPYARGAELIEVLAETAPYLRSVGVPCYPEGHALATTEALDEALRAKCFFAGHMVAQICFDAAIIRDWLLSVREQGIALPAYIGIPGVIERRKLFSIAMNIGLGDSTRFLRKNSGVFSRLAGPSRFTPDALIDELAGMFDEPRLNIAGLHINTFNQIEATESWRTTRLETVAETTDVANSTGAAAYATNV